MTTLTKNAAFLGGITLDYADGLNQSGFKVLSQVDLRVRRELRRVAAD